jgi:dihydroxyacetone kinase phosphotransfer subunit
LGVPESAPFARTRKEAQLVGLVLVSHSRTLAEGLHELVAQFAGPEVTIVAAGGTDDGRLGTSAPRIAAAIREALGPEGALVLLDFGSAVLSLELALEDLEPAERSSVQVSDAPLVEGAFLAAVQASIGGTLDEVAVAAASAATMNKVTLP